MKKAGIILIVVEILGILGGLINGSFVDMFANMNGVGDICEIVGFLSPGAVGIILLLKAKKRT